MDKDSDNNEDSDSESYISEKEEELDKMITLFNKIKKKFEYEIKKENNIFDQMEEEDDCFINDKDLKVLEGLDDLEDSVLFEERPFKNLEERKKEMDDFEKDLLDKKKYLAEKRKKEMKRNNFILIEK